MRRPFVLRVQADDPALARSIATALVAPLSERGARVTLDGQTQGGDASAAASSSSRAADGGSDFGVHVVTGDRSGLPGAALRIGVWDENEGARWLAPLDLPADPGLAAERTLSFLQTWGFIGAARAHVRAT